MFNADFVDIELGSALSSGEQVQWVVQAAPSPERKVLKQRRGQSRSGTQGSPKPSSTHKPRRVRASRAARAEERKVSNSDHSKHGGHKSEPKDPSILWLPPESEEGNVEYKLRLRDPTSSRLEQLNLNLLDLVREELPAACHLSLSRCTVHFSSLPESNGECIYYVGVDDNGYPRGVSDYDITASLDNLRYMASALRAAVPKVETFPAAHGRGYVKVHVCRKCVEAVHFVEMRVAVGGGAGSGKSTLVAILTHGVDGKPRLDDGKGRARTSVFRHKHEIQSGHTSSISQSMVGYSHTGSVLNYIGVNSPTSGELAAASQKVIHFIDLCGHSRFLRTALYGLTSLLPDCMMFCVCAVSGIHQTAREHLAAALALDIPVCAVITKVDQASAETLSARVLETQSLLASAITATTRWASTGNSTDGTTDAEAGHELGMFTTDDDEAKSAARRLQVERARLDKRVPIVDSEAKATAMAQLMCIIQQHHHPLLCSSYMIPCFLLSSTSGEGISLLHCFLSKLQQAPRRKQPVDIPKDQCDDSHSRASDRIIPSAAPGLINCAQEATSILGNSNTQYLAPEPKHLHNTISPSQLTPDKRSSTFSGRDIVHFQIDHTFELSSVGTVCSGTVVCGTIEQGQMLWWGPQESSGDFVLVSVKGIHRVRVPVAKVATGECATIAIEQATPETTSSAAHALFTEAPQSSCGQFLQAAEGNSGWHETAVGLNTPQRSKPALHSTAEAPAEQGFCFESTLPVAVPLDCAGDTCAIVRGQIHVSPSDGNLAASFADALPSLEDMLDEPPSIVDRDTCSNGAIKRYSIALHFKFAQNYASKFAETLAACETMLEFRETRSQATSSNDSLVNQESSLERLHCGGSATTAGNSRITGYTSQPVAATSLCSGHPVTQGYASSKQISESLHDISISPSPDASWHTVGLELAGLPNGDADVPGSNKGRKGTVLIDQCMKLLASWEASAYMILTSGQWPARGLITGRWPPDEEGSRSPRLNDTTWVDQQRSETSTSRKAKYRHILHCASIRQEVEVISLQELSVHLRRHNFYVHGINLAAASAAAHVLHSDPSSEDGTIDCDLIGAVVELRFRFCRTPEWLLPGMRFVMRDQTGCVSGAGVIRHA